MAIALIGFKATGKSAVGKELAQRLNVPFYDTDEVLEAQHGKAVREIYELYGENAFRWLEQEAIDNLDFSNACVVSLGGGTPLGDISKRFDQVIYLETDPQVLWERISQSPPSFMPDETSFKEVYDTRVPRYKSAATNTISTTGKSSPELAELISEALNGK